jgi:hypothetical protein
MCKAHLYVALLLLSLLVKLTALTITQCGKANKMQKLTYMRVGKKVS